MALITETWCNDEITNAMLNIQGYSIEPELRVDRTDTARGIGGGLLVYRRNDITIKPDNDPNNFIQYCKFRVIAETKTRPLNVTLFYRSPNSGEENTEKLVQIVDDHASDCLILGDLNLPNIDYNNSTSDRKGRAMLECVESKFLSQLIDFPTHTAGNTLDVAFTDLSDSVFNVEDLGNLGNSDHSIIKIELDFSPKFNKTTEKVRDWRKGDKNGLKEYLKTICWEDLLLDKNAAESWDLFTDVTNAALDKFIPLTQRRQQGKPPWMNKTVKRLTNKKKRFWKKYMSDRSNANFDEFKQVQKACKKAVRQAKRKFERNIAENGQKKTFNAYVKSKTKARTNVGPLKVDNKLYTDNKDMAKILNDYFVTVFTKENTSHVPQPVQLPSQSSLLNIQFDSATIKKKIMKLKPHSAPGPDGISARFLQDYCDELVPALTTIFNRSMSTGIIPEVWKQGNITPIFKKGVKGNPANYRPVSLTSIPCRVMESCTRDEIVDHLIANNLINKSQHGFMRNKSCTTNLLEFLEKVTKETDEGSPMDILYLDFSKAFDKVPKLRLLEKFKAHSINGNLLNWINNWLTGRKQRTVLNGESSDWEDVVSGVPQYLAPWHLLYISRT